jgi:hypothetical protein
VSTAQHTIGRLILALAVGACGGGGPGGDEAAGDGATLDVDVASEADGLHASTTIDGELVIIEAHTIVEQSVADDGTPFDQEYLVATITGSEAAPYADVRLSDLADELTGTIGGAPFADALSGDEVRADWGELASSRVGAVLTEVARRADATVAAGTYPDVERLLVLVAEPGPLLQILPTLVGGLEAVCGDGQCSIDETDESCPEDCGCAAEAACGGVAPFGCYCGDDCAASGDCCADACLSCGSGCPACPEGEVQCNPGDCTAGQVACDDGACLELEQFCDGALDCAGGEDELCTCAYCSG